MDFFGILRDWIVVVVGIEVGNAEINAFVRLSNFGIGTADDASNNNNGE